MKEMKKNSIKNSKRKTNNSEIYKNVQKKRNHIDGNDTKVEHFT